MGSKRIYENGTAELTVAASDKIAVFSNSKYKVYKLIEAVGQVPSWDLLKNGAAGESYLSSAFSVATKIRIEAGPAGALYQTGVAPSVIEAGESAIQGAPNALNATGALTAAMIFGGILTSTTAAAVAGTIPTGAVMDAAIDLSVGDSVDWSVINTGPNTFTVTAAASGHTVVGAGAVATATSGLFRTRKTAAETFITYRIG